MIEFLLLPFLTTLILTGIHVYLGLHVITRGIIFIDISLAQIAALGATVGFVFGFPLHSFGNYIFSLVFALSAAIIYSLIKIEKYKIPLEAIIGISYVFSVALAVLIMDRFPEGTEHIKYMLAGNILTVRSYEILKMFILYLIIGVIYLKIHKKLYIVSKEENLPEKFRLNLIFYTTFAIVVTSSVEVVGVLLVFTYLVVPQVTSLFFFNPDSYVKRLIFGWIFGVLVSVIGIVISFLFDFPTSTLIIALFVIFMVICGLFSKNFGV
ncbi:MAG: metal ABC transporter permease [bacterium]|nr:metal ABC transporter permease [bacterium]